MTNADVTRDESETTITLERSLGLVDEKGRAVGGFASISKEPRYRGSWVAKYAPDGTYLETVHVRGEILGYEVEIRATRDGETYGASPRSTYYGTPEAALAAAMKGLAAQAKRYAKKYAAK
jgi:hypothetical protein